MRPKVIIISGPIACGKSELSRSLRDRFGIPIVKTSDLIKERLGKTELDRKSLQRAGNKLDRDTDYAWVAEQLVFLLRRENIDGTVVIDGVRKQEQIEALQSSFGHRHTRHVHLDASVQVRRERFNKRNRTSDQGISFDDICNNLSERTVLELGKIADIVVDTDKSSESGIFSQIAARLNFVSRTAD